MEFISIKLLFLIFGSISSLVVGILILIVRDSINSNATKEGVKAKTDLLQKDITSLIEMARANEKQFSKFERKIEGLHARISKVEKDSADFYVSKELHSSTINQFNIKLDTILKFVRHEHI